MIACLGHRLSIAFRVTMVLLAGAVSSGLTFADEDNWPYQGEQRFALRRGDDALVLGQVAYTWRHDGKRYQLRSVMETTGVLALLKPTRTVQESNGTLNSEGFRPDRFVHDGRRGAESVDFDWDAGKITYRGREESLPVGTQDLLTLYAQLASRTLPSGAFDLSVATGSKLANYRVERDGDETLILRGDRHPVEHVHVTLGSERIDFWLPAGSATSAAGSPVRVASGRAVADKTGFTEIRWPLRVRITDKSGATIEQTVDAAVGVR